VCSFGTEGVNAVFANRVGRVGDYEGCAGRMPVQAVGKQNRASKVTGPREKRHVRVFARCRHDMIEAEDKQYLVGR
jgi:hypothetical protein